MYYTNCKEMCLTAAIALREIWRFVTIIQTFQINIISVTAVIISIMLIKSLPVEQLSAEFFHKRYSSIIPTVKEARERCLIKII